jgi:TolB protein
MERVPIRTSECLRARWLVGISGILIELSVLTAATAAGSLRASAPVQRIVEVRDRGTARPLYGTELWLMNPDGSGQKLLSPDRYFDDTSPSWSPNGRTLVFSHRPHGAPEQLATMEGDGSGFRKITRVSRHGWGDLDPDWSADARWIVFATSRNAAKGRDASGGLVYRTDLWLIRADGTRMRRLTRHGANLADYRDPDWSPDGRRIAFAKVIFGLDDDWGRREYTSSSIWTVSLPKGRQQLLIENAAAPAWSPDGRRIAFERGPGGHREIYVADADGSNVRRLTTGNDDRMPAWSPDGKTLVFTSNRSRGDGDVYKLNVRTRSLTRLTSSRRIELSPAWG